MEKKSKSSKGKIKNKKIPLPVVVITENECEEQRNLSISNQGVVKVNYKNQKIKLFSDIDCFSILKYESEIEEEVR